MPTPDNRSDIGSCRVAACSLALALLLVAGALSCGGRGRTDWNVVLVSIDTLRSDHLGCYGYPRQTSPNIDGLCSRSMVFQQTIAQAPSTLPSHASILTSLIPQEHGASFANRRPLADAVDTLPELLHDAGYQTASFNGGGQIAPVWGLGQGFDSYRSVNEHSFSEIVDLGLSWLDEDRDPEAPFFLFLHSFEVHHPYTPSSKDLARFADPTLVSESWVGPKVEVRELKEINNHTVTPSEADKKVIVAAYDAEIRSMDRAIGRLLTELENRALLDRTIVVFTSDHGEEFGEHGRWGWHAHTLYDELLRVPLIIDLPSGEGAGRSIVQQVRSIDIAPTILDALGIAAPDAFTGRSLMDFVRGRPVPPLLAVSVRDQPDDTRPLQSVRLGHWKLINDALYDLDRDPHESGQWLVNQPEVYLRLQKVLDNVTNLSKQERGDAITLDEETQKRLEALGYL